MNEIKYCVASVRVDMTGAEVTYYAGSNDMYGLHRVGDINDPNVIWHDTEDKALKCRFNANDCVIARHIEYIPKFKKSEK